MLFDELTYQFDDKNNKYESIKILAHNLDFWLPYFNMVIQDRLNEFERCSFKNFKQKTLLEKLNQDVVSEGLDINIVRPRQGVYVWMGEDEAKEVVEEVIEKADKKGNLRAIIDTIKSNRIEDDFSDVWSYEKEDFERKLYVIRKVIESTIGKRGLKQEDFFYITNISSKTVVIRACSCLTRSNIIIRIFPIQG